LIQARFTGGRPTFTTPRADHPDRVEDDRRAPRVVTMSLRAAAWLLAIAIVVISLVPATFRPVTPAPHAIEHLVAFATTGLAFGLGYQRRHLYQAFGLATFAGAIEVAQFLDPSRHARLSDFVVDAASACAGTMIAWLVLKVCSGTPRLRA